MYTIGRLALISVLGVVVILFLLNPAVFLFLIIATAIIGRKI